MAKSRAKELYDEYAADVIRNAAYFTACLYVSPGREVREAPTLAEARRIAREELAPLATHGRRPLIYAVGPSGKTVHVDEDYPDVHATAAA